MGAMTSLVECGHSTKPQTTATRALLIAGVGRAAAMVGKPFQVGWIEPKGNPA